MNEAVEFAKKKKAMNLRYKKPLVKELNMDDIQGKLYEISEACDNVEWFCGAKESEMLEDILGVDDTQEFKATFAMLSAGVERMQRDMSESEYLTEHFDGLMSAVAGDGSTYMGYDTYEEDYYGLTSFESMLARKEAQKRMMTLTKQQLMDAMHDAVSVIVNFASICHRYDSLSAVFDILLDKSTAELDEIRQIDELYDQMQKNPTWEQKRDLTQRMDRLIAHLPDSAWVQ